MESKPGYLTTEFWITLIVGAITWLAHAADSGAFGLKTTAALTSGLAVAYAIARGLAKQGVPYTPSPTPDEGDSGAP